MMGALFVAAAWSCRDADDHGGHGKAGADGQQDAGGGSGGAGGGAPGGAGGIASGAAGAGASSGGGAGGMCAPAPCAVPGCAVGVTPPPGTSLNDLWIGPHREVWAVGDGGFVARREPETGEWCWCAPAPPHSLNGVWGGASDNLYAVGERGVVVHFDGAQWTVTSLGARLDLRAIDGTAGNDVWTVGAQGTAFHFDGQLWSSDFVDARYEFHALWIDPTGVAHAGGRAPLPTDPNFPYMQFDEAFFLRHAPTGYGWQVEGSIAQWGGIDVLAIRGASATDIWAGGINFPAGAAQGYGGLFRFDGTAWTAVSVPDDLLANNYISDVAVNPPDGGGTLFVGSGGPLRYDGVNFTRPPDPAGATDLDVRGGDMYAVGGGGLVYRWTAQSGWIVERPAQRAPATGFF